MNVKAMDITFRDDVKQELIKYCNDQPLLCSFHSKWPTPGKGPGKGKMPRCADQCYRCTVWDDLANRIAEIK